MRAASPAPGSTGYSDILRLNFKSFRNFYLILAKNVSTNFPDSRSLLRREKRVGDDLYLCKSVRARPNNSCVKEKFVAILDLIICEVGMIELNYFVQL